MIDLKPKLLQPWYMLALALPTLATKCARHRPAHGADVKGIFGAGDGIRTHDPNLGKVVLYP
jgi:hypothetical protein